MKTVSLIVIFLNYACVLSPFQVHCLNRAFREEMKRKEQESEDFNRFYTHGVPYGVDQGGRHDV